MTPAQLACTPWVAKIKGTILLPNTSFTVTSEGGRLIDYVVASVTISKAIKVTWFKGPWAPHLGLKVSVLAAPRQLSR